MGKKKGFEIDHINGNGLDNRKSNLRFVTPRQNLQNMHTKRYSKYPGVTWHKINHRWMAQIKINGRPIYLGYFNNEYEAYLAYKKAIEKLGEEYVPVGG